MTKKKEQERKRSKSVGFAIETDGNGKWRVEVSQDMVQALTQKVLETVGPALGELTSGEENQEQVKPMKLPTKRKTKHIDIVDAEYTEEED